MIISRWTDQGWKYVHVCNAPAYRAKVTESENFVTSRPHWSQAEAESETMYV